MELKWCCILALTINDCIMKSNTLLRNLIVIIVLFFITFAIAQGIVYGNPLGVTLAVSSLLALGYCVHLFRQLVQSAEEKE